jgi:HEAT repeat protein
MKRTLRISAGVLGGLALLAGGTWVLSWALATHEPTYNGQSASYWSEQLTNHDAAVSNRAAAVVCSQIIPYLTNQMFSDTNNSKFRMAVVDRLNLLPGIQVVYIEADTRRARATYDLGCFGPTAKSAAPALIEALKRKDNVLCSPAATALGKMQADPEAAVPALIGCLLDRRGRGRPEVVDSLGEYGPRAKAAVPALTKLLRDRSSKELAKAVPRALKGIDPQAAAGASVAK